MQTILQFIPIWNQVCLDTRTEKIVNDIKSRISEDTILQYLTPITSFMCMLMIHQLEYAQL